ncbi:hypothetical protein NE237_011601 [Protea cynaroides]|uniref:Alcohol dehydrogenase n=1 Tax=Protea cynaroides TaxID=273540 RepID=A0A9Q0GY79_9MAGN|nr:hypothetical protein NE237_011601 [Protea cynaroides]
MESVRENVKEVKEGDTMIPTLLTKCQDCRDCNSKKRNKCSKFPFTISSTLPRDSTTRFFDSKGEEVYHFIHVSSFNKYTVVDIANVTKIDPSIPINRACLIGCGISTGKQKSNPKFSDSVASSIKEVFLRFSGARPTENSEASLSNSVTVRQVQCCLQA